MSAKALSELQVRYQRRQHRCLIDEWIGTGVASGIRIQIDRGAALATKT